MYTGLILFTFIAIEKTSHMMRDLNAKGKIQKITCIECSYFFFRLSSECTWYVHMAI